MKTNPSIDSTLPSDDELRQLTAYHCHTMSEAEREAFDDRLADDDAFFDRITPLLKIWHMPLPSVIAAGEQLKQRLADQQAAAVERKRRIRYWVRPRLVLVGGMAATIVSGVVLQVSTHPDAVSKVATVPATKKPATGAQPGAATPTAKVAVVAPKRKTPATHPKVIAVRKPHTADTVTKAAVVVAVTPRTDSVVATPVTTAVTVEVPKVDSTPAKVDTVVDKVDTTAARRDSTLAKVDTTWGQREGMEVIKGTPADRGSKWYWPPSWFHRKHKKQDALTRPPTLNPGQVL